MIVSLIFSVASGFVVAKFGNLRPTTMGTMVTTLGFFVLFMYHSSEASRASVLVIVAAGLALMQIGSVNVVLTSTPKQFSGISLGMNLLILPYRIHSGTHHCRHLYASQSDICRIRDGQ